MSNLIQFPQERRHEHDIVRLKSFADDLDGWILKCLENGMQPHEVAGVIAHRLGTLIKHGENPEVLLEFCEDLVRKRADPSNEDAS